MKKPVYAIIGSAVWIILLSSCGSDKPSSIPDTVQDYFSHATVIDNDPFDMDSGKWEISPYASIQDGELILLARDWYSNIYKQQITDGQGIIIEFTYTKESSFEILFLSGEWGTDQHKRFGVYIDNNIVKHNIPPLNVGNEDISGDFPLQPATPYTIMMGISQGGEFMALLWDPSDPAHVINYHKVVGDIWSGYSWTFSVGGSNGTIIFDNFKEIAFDGIINK
jgi:hypothetical protein